MQDRWGRWEDIKEQAEDLLEAYGDFVNPQGILESVPALNTAAMVDQYRPLDRRITEESLEAAEEYIEDLTEWLQQAIQVSQAIRDFNDSIDRAKQDLIDTAALDALEGNVAGQKSWYLTKIREGLAAIEQMDPEDALEKANELYNLTLSRYDLEKSSIEEISGLIENIDQMIRDLKYSDYNITLPTPIAEEAKGDYKTLLDAIKVGGATEIQEYLGFVNTFLETQRAAFQSSQDYIDAYEMVMKDLENLGLSLTDVNQSAEAILLEETNSLLDEIKAAMKAQDRKIADAMAPHIALLTEAVSEGGSIDVVLSEIHTEIQRVAGYLEQITAAIYGQVGLKVGATSSNLTNSGLTHSALWQQNYTQADAFGQTIMRLQAAGYGGSHWSANDNSGITADHVATLNAVNANPNSANYWMYDSGTNTLVAINRETGAIKDFSDQIPEAYYGGDFRAPLSGGLVEIHGAERITPLNAIPPQPVVIVNNTINVNEEKLKDFIDIRTDTVVKEREDSDAEGVYRTYS